MAQKGREPTAIELNGMESFIDFLKGVLRIDPKERWTPRLA